MSNISINAHSSIKYEGDKIVYFDPFKIEEEVNDADLILITHDHFDHFSPEDIKKVSNESTIMIMPVSSKTKAVTEGFGEDGIITVLPCNEISVKGINIKTVPAYNKNKQFHLKNSNWVGYVIEDGTEKVYVAGDTDALEENENIVCDIALVPVGGTYTMTAKEAAVFVNKIKPSKAIPTHYGSITGSSDDGMIFCSMLDKDIDTEILI